MKSFCMFVAASWLALASAAQTTSGSASGNASVTPGQVGAGASASSSTQAAGASANANASARAQVSDDSNAKNQSKSKSREGSGGSKSSSSSSSTASSATLNSGAMLQAELTKSLDAKNVKPGDQVTARVTEDVKADGKVVVHKGSKLVGHVTEAQARTKENTDSKLGIVFDKAVLKGGQELSFNGTLQALAPPVHTALSAAGDESSSISGPEPMGGSGARRSGGGGGLLGGTTSTTTGVVANTTGAVAGTTTGAVNGTVSGVTGVAGGLTAQGTLTSASQGALGLQGLTLNSAAAGSAQGSVVSSTTRTVKLDSGTQLLLKVTGSAQ